MRRALRLSQGGGKRERACSADLCLTWPSAVGRLALADDGAGRVDGVVAVERGRRGRERRPVGRCCRLGRVHPVCICWRARARGAWGQARGRASGERARGPRDPRASLALCRLFARARVSTVAIGFEIGMTRTRKLWIWHLLVLGRGVKVLRCVAGTVARASGDGDGVRASRPRVASLSVLAPARPALYLHHTRTPAHSLENPSFLSLDPAPFLTFLFSRTRSS